MRWIPVLAVLLLVRVAIGAPSEEPSDGSAIIVTATRRTARLFETPVSARLLDADVLAHVRATRSLPEALAEEPSVMVQKTSPGQASPFIRGFTGFRTLLLVDGIRLNNSVFREGPNQYWGLVDPLTVERLELVGGPSSVLFGSDAVGGTVNALLRSAPESSKTHGGGRLYGRLASAERSGTGRVEVHASKPDSYRILGGVSLRDHGDVRTGPSVGVLERSGYEEDAADLRLDLDPTERLVVTIGGQRVRQNDVPRTHSTVDGESWRGTTVGSDLRRDLDEARDLVYARAVLTPEDAFFERLEVTLSWQRLEEEQNRVRSSGLRDISGFEVGTLGVAAQISSETAIGVLTGGLEWYHDRVSSHRRKIDVDGTVSKQNQGPVADDATYDLLGVYLQDEVEVAPWLTVTAGARVTYAAANADTVAVAGEETSLDDSWTNVVGSLRAVARPHDAWRVFGGVSQGFRAPNLSDLTRLDSARSGEVETPSPDLDPERFLSWEIGVRARQDGWSLDVTAYWTCISDLITRFPTGQEIDGEAEVRKANVGDGWVRGLEARVAVDVAEEWSVYCGVALVEGEVDVYPTADMTRQREHVSRLAPTQGLLGLRWRQVSGRAWAELQGVFAAAADDLSSRDERDTQRIPPGGTPGYGVARLRGGVTLAEGVRLFAAVENVLDCDYRVHGSGQNAFGRNFVLGIDLTF